MASFLASLALVSPCFCSGWLPRQIAQVRILDEQGRDRLILGAPVKDPNRIDPMAGLIILDQYGHERVGMGVYNQGNASIGLDAPMG